MKGDFLTDTFGRAPQKGATPPPPPPVHTANTWSALGVLVLVLYLASR